MMNLTFSRFKIYFTLFLLLGIFENIFPQIYGHFWWLNFKDKTTSTTTVYIATTEPAIPSQTTSFLNNKDIICCECVQFYLCLNGTIISDGMDIIDLRIGNVPPIQTERPPVINVDICPTDGGDLQVCCEPPDVNPACLKTYSSLPTITPLTTPHPNSHCECVVYKDCNPSLVVSNGLGNTSLELTNGRIVSHDKCNHSLEVCCFLPDVFLADAEAEIQRNISIPNNYDEDCPECAPRNLCDDEGYIIEDGSDLLDLRFGVGLSATLQKQCPHNPMLVCCRLKNYTKEPEHGDNPRVTPELVIEAPSRTSLCGTRNFKGIGTRILGFQEGQTQFGEFPWVATLLKRQPIGNNEYPLFLGGASLIHKRVVMTAAHKLNGLIAEDLWIRLGEWDVASEKEALPFQDIFVEEIIIHPLYNPGPLHHDIALLVLKNEAKVDDHIGTICLPSSLDEVDTSSCVINGWGVNEFASGNYQKLMKSVHLPIVDEHTCQSLLRKTRLSKYFRLHSSFICAGGEEGKDACKGDGGGPLACRSKSDYSRYYQFGITAWGIGCGEKDVPGVYVNVAKHFDWINAHLRDRFAEHKPLSSTADVPIEHKTKDSMNIKAYKKLIREKLRKDEQARKVEDKIQTNFSLKRKKTIS